MSRALLNKITLALAVVGCIIALVLSYEHFFPAADIGCSAVAGNCHNTIESKFGKLGPIPTSVIGLGMYLTLAGICILRARSLSGKDTSGIDEKRLSAALFGISLLAFCISWGLQYASFFVIFSFCPWCFASALTVTAIFLVNSYDHLILGRTLTGEQKMLTGVVLFIGAMLAFMYYPQIRFQVKMVLTPHAEMIPAPPTRNQVGDHPREQIVREGLVYKGKPTAQYTLIEFADYGCSHCKEGGELVDQVLKKYPDRFRVGFRNFPLGEWPWSIAEAEAAEAAAKQGKFWEMHDYMFAHQDEIKDPRFDSRSITAWAKAVGLNIDQFQKDMNGGEMKAIVVGDHDTAVTNNVKMTPSFFVVPSDPKAKVMLLIGLSDARTMLNDPKDPFWSGNPVNIKDPETALPQAPPPSAPQQ